MRWSVGTMRTSVNVVIYAMLVLGRCGAASAPEAARPRGVSLSRAALYAPGDTFTCLDGSATVPYSHLNDDYCDCRDGTDEPGTAACLNGLFHCLNKGHVPKDIPSSRVNDGICDCCDGSDEYASNAECTDICSELGREARLRARKMAELRAAGARLRSQAVKDGANMKTELQERLVQLDAQRAEADRLKLESQQMRDDAELLENAALQQYREAEEAENQKRKAEEAESGRREAEENFLKFDSNGDGLVDVSELQSRVIFDKDRNGEVSSEEAAFFLGEKTELNLEEFIENAWPLVKPYLMMGENLFVPPSSDSDSVHETESETEEEESEQHEEEEEADDEEIHETEEETSEEPVEEHSEPSPQYDEETQRLVNSATEARNHFAQAEKAVRDLDSEIDKVKGMLNKDYGLQEEFATLVGQCFEFNDREYIYKLCPFDKATQQPKSSGGETNLGTWGEWVGSGENKYEAMMYSNGISCWNGPDRSTRVNINCGLENRITSVAEPNRCEYVMEMETPVACIDNETENSDNRAPHDEL